MQKCQHGKAIVKFCLFEHCQSKETGGCEDCIKKYHNHIGQISFLTEEDIKNIVKKFQIEANYRPKSRSLQQGIFNFFTHIKTNISINLDVACKNLINEIGYPYLQKNGTLNCYKRLKNKQYRKVSQKELKQLWEIYKTADYNEVLKRQKVIYNQAVSKMQETLQKLQKNLKEIFQNLSSMVSVTKSNAAFYDRTYYLKINDIFKEIKKYPNIVNSKIEEPRQLKKDKEIFTSQESSNEKKKPTRDVSLDRHVKMENNLKNTVKSKLSEQNGLQQSKKQTKQERNIQHQRKQPQRQKQSVVKKGKYSIDLKPQQVTLGPPPKIQSESNEYSQKQEQILERKKKLMELMNIKPLGKREDVEDKNKVSSLNSGVREKSYSKRPQLSDYLKQALSPGRLIVKDVTGPQKDIKEPRQQSSTASMNLSQRQSFTSKRAKTTYQQEQQTVLPGSKKQTRNQTLMSSETQTEQLFHAIVNIPIEDSKPEEQFENEESVQKCIVVTEVDTLAREILNMHSQMQNQCQSPLLRKKKEIQTFSAFMKLAESKIIEEQEEESPKYTTPVRQEDRSFVKMHKVVNESNASPVDQLVPETNKKQPNEKQSANEKNKLTQSGSIQMNDNEQFSLALLLKSLKLAGPQAIPYLQKSLQYSQNNLSAAQYLSYLYLQAERPQDCLKLCIDILKLISSSQTNDLALRLNINKSAAMNQLGRYSECITFLQRCLRYRHNDQLYKNLADAYYSVGILEKAIYNYQHAIIQNSANTQAHYNLAVCHYQQENYYNASIYVQKALKHQPTNQVYKEMKKYIDEKILANQIR